MLVLKRGNNITQIACYENESASRSSGDGGVTWGEWEYVNPQMVPGIEYRTTERLQGKPVYAMCVSCGALPNSASTFIEGVLPYNITAISATGFAKSSTESLSIPGEQVTIAVNNEWGYIIITTTSDKSGYTESYVTVKYIKK